MIPSTAFACWDGAEARDGGVCVSWSTANADEGPIAFSFDDAREAAHATRQLRSIARPGESIDVVFGYESSCGDDSMNETGAPGIVRICRGGDCAITPLVDATLEEAVDAVARATKRSVASRAASRVWTLQVIAARSQQNAQAIEARLEDFTPGFYVTAGHPGRAFATASTTRDGWHRVFVGAFLSEADAERARGELARERHVAAFVRIAP